MDFNDDSDAVYLDAEPDESTGFQVNYFLLCLAPVTLLLMKIFYRIATWVSLAASLIQYSNLLTRGLEQF